MRGPRGSGRTTRQIQHLPKGGYFFCDGRLIPYMVDKVIAVKRFDVRITAARHLADPYQFCGLARVGAAVDHAYAMSAEEEAGWKLVKIWVWPVVP